MGGYAVMKKSIFLLLTLALLLGVLGVFSIVANADEVEPQMSIAYCNLSFRDTVCIKYAVASNVSDAKILIWTSPEADYTVGTHDSEITEYYTENIGGTPHMVFDYTELSAKQMTDVVYARAYTRVDGVDYYSEVNKYSILQYAYNKLATSTDAKLKALLSDMLVYGASAQEYFGYHADRLATATWYQIKVTAGWLDDGMNHGLYLQGDKVTLTAPETDAEGKIFSCWVDESGNEVATTATFEVTVGTANAVYTPVYAEPQIGSVGLAFTSNGDGTCYVSGIGTCTDTDIVIPTKSPAGDTVTSIGSYAFENCSRLTSVTIPDSVTSIGAYAFYKCSRLTSVTIPDSVTSIGSSAFENCSRLTSVTISNGVTSIGDYAFYYCRGLTSVTIPDSVTSIGDGAFEGCNMASVTIGDSVTSIGSSTFKGCDMASVTIPDSVTSIGSSAFEHCFELTSVTIGDSVTSIGSSAFYGCYKLVEVYNRSTLSITVGSSSNGYVASYAKNVYTPTSGQSKLVTKDGYLFCGDNSGNYYLVDYQGTDAALVLPADINGSKYAINQDAFYNCDDITSVTIPDSVTSIGSSAFSGCSGLTSVTIPDSVTSIGYRAFEGCSNLTRITFKDTTTWYRTTSSSGWNNMTGGTSTSVTSPSTNATYFTSTYYDYYWYKK